MRYIKCPNCGASTKNNGDVCAYCGSELSTEPSSVIDTNVKPSTLAVAIENSLPTTKSGSAFALLFMIIFFSVWCGGTTFAGISTIRFDAGFISFVPFFMTGMGILAFLMVAIPLINQMKQEKLITKYISLVKEHKFDEAFVVGDKIKMATIAQALIAFYHKKDFDLAKEYILQTNTKSFSIVSSVSPLVANMYKYFGYDLPQK